MAHIEMLAALLAASMLIACGQAEPAEADPMAFENTKWLQTEEETEEALGISLEGFEKTEEDGTVTYRDDSFEGTLPVSGSKPAEMTLLFVPVFPEEPNYLRRIGLSFTDEGEQEKFESFLTQVYGEPEERILNPNVPETAYDAWEAEGEKERVSIRRTSSGKDGREAFLITYGWTEAYSAELLEQAASGSGGE